MLERTQSGARLYAGRLRTSSLFQYAHKLENVSILHTQNPADKQSYLLKGLSSCPKLTFSYVEHYLRFKTSAASLCLFFPRILVLPTIPKKMGSGLEGSDPSPKVIPSLRQS